MWEKNKHINCNLTGVKGIIVSLGISYFISCHWVCLQFISTEINSYGQYVTIMSIPVSFAFEDLISLQCACLPFTSQDMSLVYICWLRK